MFSDFKSRGFGIEDTQLRYADRLDRPRPEILRVDAHVRHPRTRPLYSQTALGEETDNPRRDIPRAIATAVITMGVFYTIVMFAQTLGFGVDKQGTEAFASSSSPLGELSR